PPSWNPGTPSSLNHSATAASPLLQTSEGMIASHGARRAGILSGPPIPGRIPTLWNPKKPMNFCQPDLTISNPFCPNSIVVSTVPPIQSTPFSIHSHSFPSALKVQVQVVSAVPSIHFHAETRKSRALPSASKAQFQVVVAVSSSPGHAASVSHLKTAPTMSPDQFHSV